MLVKFAGVVYKERFHATRKRFNHHKHRNIIANARETVNIIIYAKRTSSPVGRCNSTLHTLPAYGPDLRVASARLMTVTEHPSLSIQSGDLVCVNCLNEDRQHCSELVSEHACRA